MKGWTGKITVDLQKVIGVWCMLDNLWGWLEHSKTVHNNLQTKDRIISQQNRIDIMRDELMQACGFEDFDEFVSFIEKQDFVSWNNILNMWIIQ